MLISTRTRSRRKEATFSIDSESYVEDTPVIVPAYSPTTALYNNASPAMESAPAVDTSSEEFQRAVQEQVQQATQDMITDGTLASSTSAGGSSSGSASGGSGSGTSRGGASGSSLPASPTSVIYSTNPFKSNFNPGDKH